MRRCIFSTDRIVTSKELSFMQSMGAMPDTLPYPEPNQETYRQATGDLFLTLKLMVVL